MTTMFFDEILSLCNLKLIQELEIYVQENEQKEQKKEQAEQETADAKEEEKPAKEETIEADGAEKLVLRITLNLRKPLMQHITMRNHQPRKEKRKMMRIRAEKRNVRGGNVK